jgi:hypothetical protein
MSQVEVEVELTPERIDELRRVHGAGGKVKPVQQVGVAEDPGETVVLREELHGQSSPVADRRSGGKKKSKKRRE